MHGNRAFLALFYQILLLLFSLESSGITFSLSFHSMVLFWVVGNLLARS